MKTDKSKLLKPLNKRRSIAGNTLAIAIGLVVLLIIVGFFFLNYSHILEQTLVGKTAAEAAALQFAKDMAKVVYTDPVTGNKIALVDQPADELLPSNAPNVNAATRPILGVNTQIAINRLDEIIAAQCGNSSMQYAANYDWTSTGGLRDQITAMNALFQTKQAVDGWVDKGGNLINVYNDVQNYYKENLRLRGSNSTLVENSLTYKFIYKKVTEGQTSNIATNAPAPATISGNPEDVDVWEVKNGGRGKNYMSVNVPGQAGGQLVYMAYQPYYAADSSQQCTAADNNGYSVTFPFPANTTDPFVFTAVAPQPSILSNSDPQYKDWTGQGTDAGDTLPPAIVQIGALEENKQLQNATDNIKNGEVAQTATAQVGGPLQQYPTGAFCVGFPQGIPIDSTPNTFNIFHSVLSIMDWSQVNPELKADSVAPNIGWNSASLGHWFQVVNGPLFPSGLTTAQSSGTNAHFKHMHVIKGRSQHDDPSIACSFAAYDWIKSLGVYPKVDTIVRALSLSANTSIADITALPAALAKFPITSATGFSVDAGDPAITMNSSGDWFGGPAYAQSSGSSSTDSDVAGLGFALAAGANSFTNCNPTTVNPTGDALLQNEIAAGNPALDTKDPRNMLNHCSGQPGAGSRDDGALDRDQSGAAFGNTDHSVTAPAGALVLAIHTDGSLTTADGSPLPHGVDMETALVSTSFDAAGDTVNGGVPNPTGAYQHGYEAWGNASGLTVADPPPGVPSAIGLGKNGVQSDGTGGLTSVKPSSNATLADGTTQYSNYSVDQNCTNIAADIKYINNQLKNDPVLKLLPSSDPNVTAVTNAVTSIKSSNDDIQNTQNKVVPDIFSKDGGYNGDKIGAALAATDTDAKAINTQCNNLLNGNSTASPAIAALPSTSTSPWLNVISALKEIQTMAAGSMSGNTATTPAGGDILACNTVKKRAVNTLNNAFYVGTVVTQIFNNQKVLTAVSLTEVSKTHYTLAGSDLWCMPSGDNAAESLIEGSGKIATGQDSGCPGVQDWAADLPTGVTAYDGSKSQLVVYKITANATAGYPAIGSQLINPAYAQVTGTTATGTFVAANASMRMLIFSMGINGDIWVTTSPQTPFATTGLLDGQFVYQNILAINQNVPAGFGGGQEFWLVEARDLNANAKGVYFANENQAVGTNYNSQWCSNDGHFGSYTKHPPTCQHVAAEFRISCPIFQTTCQPVTSLNLDGSAGPGNTCPPPNPCGS